MPDLAAYQAYLVAEENHRVTGEALVAAKAAFAASLPEGVPFATAPDSPPHIQRVGDTIELVKVPFLGDPYPATA